MKYPNVKSYNNKKYAVIYHTADDIPTIKIYGSKPAAQFAMRQEAFKQFHKVADTVGCQMFYEDGKSTPSTFTFMRTVKECCSVCCDGNRIVIDYRYNDDEYGFFNEYWDVVEVDK